MIIFFFKQKTAYEMRISDWSSDVCSSDLTTDYTVSGVGGESFNVVFTTPPASDATISITRVVPLLQETDYLDNDEFPAETHERALDLLTMMVQIGRASWRARVCQ